MLKRWMAMPVLLLACAGPVWAAQCPPLLEGSLPKLRSKESIDLCQRFAGKPLVIVNTASFCGFAPQFKGLEALNQRYKDQGLDQQPTIKMGVEATAMERRGITTEKGNTNRAIKARNKLVADNHIKQEADNERRISALRKGLAWATEKNARLPGCIGDTKQRADFAKQLSGSSEPHITYCTEQNNRTAIRVDDTKRCVEDAKSGIAWAAKRCENLPKRCDDTKQRINGTKQAIEGITEAIRKSDIEINKATERSARPAPNTFDDAARRARAARLDQQQRRIDRETRRATYEDKRRSERAEQLKLILAHKLLTATQPDNCLRPGWNEDPNDYPDKYDYRQIEVIKEFVTSLNLQSKNFRDNWIAVKNKIDERFIANNKEIIYLVNHPKQEREQYNERLTAWFEFKEDIDQKRADFNQSIIPKLGGSAGEVGRMTRDIISSFDYIRGLDQFISDDKQTIEARELAKSHRSDTLNRTCQQFKYAYSDVAKLPSGQRESYINALNSTIEMFKNIYGSQLPDEQNKAIEAGLRAFNNDLQRSHRPSRGFSR